MHAVAANEKADEARRFRGRRTRAITVLIALVLWQFVSTGDVLAQSRGQSGTSQLVTGAACFLLTPVYGAFKLAFAGTGAIVGGLTWLFTGGDRQAANQVWDAALKDTYTITPDHLRGTKPVEFIGST